MGVQLIQFLPVDGEGIGLDSFGVIQAKEVNGAFYGVKIHHFVVVGQMEFAWMGAGDD